MSDEHVFSRLERIERIDDINHGSSAGDKVHMVHGFTTIYISLCSTCGHIPWRRCAVEFVGPSRILPGDFSVCNMPTALSRLHALYVGIRRCAQDKCLYIYNHKNVQKQDGCLPVS
jgi:hypothetical protein